MDHLVVSVVSVSQAVEVGHLLRLLTAVHLVHRVKTVEDAEHATAESRGSHEKVDDPGNQGDRRVNKIIFLINHSGLLQILFRRIKIK